MRQTCFACLCAIFLLILFCNNATADDLEIQAQQTKIRAAYLYHFLQLVKWPGEDSSTTETPFTICISGRDPFGDVIEVVAKKKARGKSLNIRRLADTRQFEQCHILYISTSQTPYLAEILKAADLQNVLTVSDCKDFVAKGGMIGFIAVPDESEGGFRVRFEVNLAAARKHSLTINSKLLELATHVRQ